MEPFYSEKYKLIADDLIGELPDLDYIRKSDVRIVFMESDKAKKSSRKTVYADCRQVAKEYRFFCPYDFMITVYEPNVRYFTEEQIRILLHHELLHVGIDNSEEEYPKYYLVPHDIEEFRVIMEKHGFDWSEHRDG